MICAVKPYEGQEPYIFFSYCHDDEAIVYPIIEQMGADGYRIWYDDGIHPGEDWPEVIARNIAGCAVCVAAVTNRSVESHNCRNEITFVVNENKTFIPVIMEQFQMSLGVKLQLGSGQYIVKYNIPSESDFFSKLYQAQGLEACRGRQSQIDPHRRDLETKRREEAEEERKRREETEEERKRREETEEERRRKEEAEEERRRKEEAEEERRRREDAEEERRRKEEAEEERRRKEEAEEERRRKEEAEEKRRRKEEAEEERRRKEEAEKERRRKEEAEEERRRREEAEETPKRPVPELETDQSGCRHDAPDGVNPVYQTPESDWGKTPKRKNLVKALLIRVSDGAGFPLEEDTCSLGRGRTCTVFLDDKYVEPEHAVISQNRGEFAILAHRSVNGTLLNGKELPVEKQTALRSPAMLDIAGEPYLFLAGGDAERAEITYSCAFLESKETKEQKALGADTLPLGQNHVWENGTLSDERISHEHGRIVPMQNGGYGYEAHKQPRTNGTYYNGDPVSPGEQFLLRDGDRLGLGKSCNLIYRLIKLRKEENR